MAKQKRAAGPKRTEPVVTGGKDMAALIRKAQDAPTSGGSWKAEVVGDSIAGTILSMKEEDGRFGPQTVVILDTGLGAQTVFCNASLKRGLDEGGAKIGDLIAVCFKGAVSTGKGRPFKTFSVAVQRGKGKR